MRTAPFLVILALGCGGVDTGMIADTAVGDGTPDAAVTYGSTVAPRSYRVALAIVDMEDIPTSDRISFDGVQRALNETVTYFRETTQGRVVLEAAPQLFRVRLTSRYEMDGHTIRDGDYRYLYNDVAPRIRAALAAQNVRTEDYDLFGYVLFTEHPWSGIAQAGCDVQRGDHCQAFFDDTLENVRLYAHEFAHDFGLTHTTALRDDGTLHQYGDYTCVMGGSWCASSFAVPQLRRLGVVTDTNIIALSETNVDVDPAQSYAWDVDIAATTSDFSNNAVAAEITLLTRRVEGRADVARRLVVAHRKGRGVDVNLINPDFINTRADAFSLFQVYEVDHRHHNAATPYQLDYNLTTSEGVVGRRFRIEQIDAQGERVRFHIELTTR